MINKLLKSNAKIIIICGHYGSGKTNISVNVAMELQKSSPASTKITFIDLDIVNPFFRGADSANMLEDAGIRCIMPTFANTNSDMPALPPEINSIFSETQKENENMRTIIDVGGDDAGAIALGMFADKIKKYSYEMVYVVNKYRPLIENAGNAVNLARAIEEKSRLKLTALINNSNIGEFTTEQSILDTFDYAETISDKLGVPLLANTAFTEIAGTELINKYTKQIF